MSGKLIRCLIGLSAVLAFGLIGAGCGDDGDGSSDPSAISDSVAARCQAGVEASGIEGAEAEAAKAACEDVGSGNIPELTDEQKQACLDGVASAGLTGDALDLAKLACEDPAAAQQQALDQVDAITGQTEGLNSDDLLQQCLATVDSITDETAKDTGTSFCNEQYGG